MDQPERPPTTRRLFLDDDPLRSEAFLAVYPDAVCVETAEACIARLAEAWDEVHLDHDLGGEVHVDPTRTDCGMEVVRWLSLTPRPHLRTAKFSIHTHNGMAAMMMSLQLKAAGYRVVVGPFDGGGWKPVVPRASLWARVSSWVRRGPGGSP